MSTAAPRQPAAAAGSQCLVHIGQRIEANARVNGDGVSDGEEVPGVGACEVRHRSDGLFLPQKTIRKGRNIAHVNAGTHHDAAGHDPRKGVRHERRYRREGDGAVERHATSYDVPTCRKRTTYRDAAVQETAVQRGVT